MSTPFNIKLLNPPKYNPYSTGFCEFDLYNTKLEENRSLLEVDDLDNITTEYVTGIVIPDTSKNRYYLCSKLSPVPKGTTVPIIVSNEYQEMPYKYLVVRNYNKKEKSLEVDLVASINKWSTKLKDLKLCDVDLGLSFPLNVNLSDTGAWLDDERPVFNLLAYYQNVIKNKWATWELRPWIPILYVLRQIFCTIGYTFRSPVFESEYMRHLWWYGLSKEFYNYQGKGWYNFEAQSDADYTYGDANVLVFDNEITDPDNLWQATNVIFNNTSPSEKVIEVELNFNAAVVGSSDAFSIQWELDGVLIYETFFTTPSDVQDFLTVTIPIGSQLTFRVECANPAALFTKNAEGYVKGKAAEKGITPGDNPQMNALIGCTDAINYVKGCLHLIEGKIIVDEINKVFWIFHKSTSDVYTSAQIQGLHRKGKDDVDISSLKVTDSEIIQNEEIIYGKVTLSFKEFDDPYLEQLENETTALPVHGRTFLIDENLEEEKKLENPFFLPTLNKYSYNPADLDLPFNSGFNLDLPMILDNPDGELSFDVGNRIVYLEPLGIEYFNGGAFYGNPAQKGWYFEDLAFNPLFQLGSQFSHAQYDDDPLGVVPTYVPGARLVFGNWAGNFDSLYSEFWKDKIYNYLSGIGSASIELLKDVCLLLRWDFFRRRLYLPMLDTSQVYTPSNLRITHGDKTAFLELKPYSDSEAICNCLKDCDCIWKECEYYLDQSGRLLYLNVSDWTISSFKINGSEKLLSPHDVGTVWNWHVVGASTVYIENFVDTLNLISNEASLDMEFGYSDRLIMMNQEEAKFMLIKYPYCNTFEIIIQIFGINQMKITDSQVYQWDGEIPGWTAPIGYYGSDPPELPENCTSGLWLD